MHARSCISSLSEGAETSVLRSDPDRISYQIEFLILLYCSAVASGSAGTLREHRGGLLLIISHHGWDSCIGREEEEEQEEEDSFSM